MSADFLAFPMSASKKITGYTTAAIHGKGIPKTRDSGCARKLVQEKVSLISQKLPFRKLSISGLSARYAWWERYAALIIPKNASTIIARYFLFIMKKLKNKIPHEWGIEKINLQQKTYNSREKMSENLVPSCATIDQVVKNKVKCIVWIFLFSSRFFGLFNEKRFTIKFRIFSKNFLKISENLCFWKK